MEVSFGNRKLRLNVFNVGLELMHKDDNEYFMLDAIDSLMEAHVPQLLYDDVIYTLMNLSIEEICNLSVVFKIQELVVIYYVSKTLSDAQYSCITTEKELLAVVFSLDKLLSYLLGSRIVVFTDHVAVSGKMAALKFLQCGFYWPSIFRNALLGINFMGLFLSSFGFEYILLIVDYVSKWVEAIATRTNDHKVVVNFVQLHMFSHFSYSYAIINDGGSHFTNRQFGSLLRKYSITYKVVIPYHPQTSGQVERANREIKTILKKIVQFDHKDWLMRLNEAL
ncbi:uncharacterized protein LOC116106696 [Pistacia vera]|uniref:uncharacterized protein LOC116106696 n=1 Tax=Pistacia vera TaxID=55513 RepID=UPI00126361DC|nr:uncharacterized protein LOC116106696 [Pistacia vera]